MRPLLTLTAALSLLFLTACQEEQVANLPSPQEMSEEANGYYCLMTLADHPGPKGQVFLESNKEPYWFPSVRDALAFTLLPGEAKDIQVIYVNDMAVASTWDRPEPGSWVSVQDAWFVVGTGTLGGMGQEEIVPFSDKSKAQSYQTEHGGRVTRLKDITFDDVFQNAATNSSGGEG
ncbi:nitrous oxide reductase accessory protein NosL [Rhodovibrionaceae bacterium A322]